MIVVSLTIYQAFCDPLGETQAGSTQLLVKLTCSDRLLSIGAGEKAVQEPESKAAELGNLSRDNIMCYFLPEI
jgi:hypothetical protein